MSWIVTTIKGGRRRADGISLYVLMWCVWIFVSWPVQVQADHVVDVILDTDISSDVDDVGAVAVIHALANQGKIRILAMMISSGDPWSASCLGALNSSFGRPEIPIGAIKGEAVRHESKFTKHIAASHPTGLSSGPVPEAVNLYRAVLATQPDNSATIVSIGYLSNLKNLLESGSDASSSLDGVSLVRKKVKLLVCMGGQFPSGKEWNFYQDTAASMHVVSNWPTPIIFSGYEIGYRIMTGAALRQTPDDHPLHQAYQLYNGLENRHSWDQTAVLLAIHSHQDEKYWKLSGRGTVRVDSTGKNSWLPERDGTHRYVEWTQKTKELARVIDRLMLQAADTKDHRHELFFQ